MFELPGAKQANLLSADAPKRVAEEELLVKVGEALQGKGLKHTDLAKQIANSFGEAEGRRAVQLTRDRATDGPIRRVVQRGTEWFFGADPIARLDRVVPELLRREGRMPSKDLKAPVEQAAPGHSWLPGDSRPPSELFAELIEEMERRFQLTRTSGADNLSDHVRATRKPLARIVCVCDEYIALISQDKEERRQIEAAVALLGAKARAAGIHLVLATQQPSRAVITGIIQANLPCRVALALSSHIESNMILGTRGAERLTGSGDLLYKDLGDPIRLQAPYLSAAERGRWLRG